METLADTEGLILFLMCKTADIKRNGHGNLMNQIYTLTGKRVEIVILNYLKVSLSSPALRTIGPPDKSA